MQKGGRASKYIYLSGPVQICYLQSDEYPDKKIILMADMHESNKRCDDRFTPNYDIHEYLEGVYNDTSIKTLDLFIEHDWSHVKKNLREKKPHMISDDDWIGKSG